MKFLAILLLMMPFALQAQENQNFSFNEKSAGEILKAFRIIDSLVGSYKNGHASTTINDIKPFVDELVNIKSYWFVNSDSLSAVDKLGYIDTVSEGLLRVISLYQDTGMNKPIAETSLLYKVFFHLHTEKYKLVDQIILEDDGTNLIIIANMYIHPLFQATFQLLSPNDKPIREILESANVDICTMSDNHFKFYKQHKSLLDETWISSYNWKVQDIGAKHWSQCVRQSALKNL